MSQRNRVSQHLTQLRARAGLTMAETARLMGKRGPSSIQRYFNNYDDELLDVRIAHEFLEAFRGRGQPPITDADVLGLCGVGPASIPEPSGVPAAIVAAPDFSQMPLDVPVLGTAVGGSSGDFTFNNGVVDYVRRPPGIARNRSVFCVFLRGDSMAPRLESGDLLYCNPSRPARPGDDVLVELHPSAPGEAGAAYVKRLDAQTPTKLILRQYNPPKRIEIPLARILRVCPILRTQELLGL